MKKGTCTTCSSRVPMYAAVCPNCGIRLNWSGVKEIKATCPSCGRYTTSASPQCAHCGTAIDWTTTYQTKQTNKVAALGALGSGISQIGCAITLLVFVVIPLLFVLWAVACH